MMDLANKLFDKMGPTESVLVVCLVALAWFLWRLTAWFKPWGEKLITSHLSMISTVQDSSVKQAESMVKLAELGQLNTDSAKAHGTKLDEILDHVKWCRFKIEPPDQPRKTP